MKVALLRQSKLFSIRRTFYPESLGGSSFKTGSGLEACKLKFRVTGNESHSLSLENFTRLLGTQNLSSIKIAFLAPSS